MFPDGISECFEEQRVAATKVVNVRWFTADIVFLPGNSIITFEMYKKSIYRY